MRERGRSASRGRAVRYPLLQFHGFWEEDVVLQVDMPVQVRLELLQHGHSRGVGDTAVRRVGITVTQFLDATEALPLRIMVVHHHRNGLADAAEMRAGYRRSGAACFLQLLDEGE